MISNYIFVAFLCTAGLRTEYPSYTTTNFQMLSGKIVSIDVYNENLVNSYPNDPLNTYGATKVGDASYYYNCYTYALLVYGNENVFPVDSLYCVKNISQYFYGSSCFGSSIFFDQQITYSATNVHVGDLIFYKPTEEEASGGTYEFSHVAVVTQVGNTLADLKVISKWGMNGIYEGLLTQCQYYTGVTPNCDYGTRFSCYRSMHSYNSYGCIASVNRFYHKKICEYCNNTIVEPHNFTLVNNSMLCNTCGYRGIIINAPIE